ncbi:MAG: cyclase family protein, partial [Gemmatimonadota bacterium]
ITAADLAARGHGGATRLLVRTGCDWRGGFPPAFRGLAPDAAAWCVAERLVLVGTDAPSVDPFDSTSLAAHRVLMAGGIAVLESLALEGVEAGPYELVALPLRLLGADASPVRAVLRPLPPGGTTAP